MKNYYQPNIRSQSTVNDKPTVFISYNWGNKDFVDKIEAALKGRAQVHRDTNDIRAWESIIEFMKSIRKQDFSVLVISDAYLKSNACLYEVVQLMKDEQWANKTMYVVMDDAHGIYNASGRADYISFWQQEYEKLKSRITSLSPDATAHLSTDLNRSKIIHLNIGEFMSMVSDTKNPSIEDAISEINNRVVSSDKPIVEKGKDCYYIAQAENIIMQWFASTQSRPGYIIMPQHFLHLKTTIKNPKVGDMLGDAIESLIDKGLLAERKSDKQIELTQIGYDSIY